MGDLESTLVTTAMPATKQEAFLFLGRLGPEVLAEAELGGGVPRLPAKSWGTLVSCTS